MSRQAQISTPQINLTLRQFTFHHEKEGNC